jgi:excisionase family DNA binding protein
VTDMVAIFLPDGRALALAPEALRAALAAGAAMGLGAAVLATTTTPERWLNSEELGGLLGIHSTTVEAMAKRSEIPHIRAGKALRFEASAVKAALKSRAARD